MTSPLRMTFDVECSAEHAFDVWTTRLGSWWPRDHTVSGRAEFVVLQGGVGGRIYERTPEGVEHNWGEVTLWEPPRQLGYLWHLGRDRAGATEVAITFQARGETATRIEIEHRGWERLGAESEEWKGRNRIGWEALLPHYLAALAPSTTLEPAPIGAPDDVPAGHSPPEAHPHEVPASEGDTR